VKAVPSALLAHMQGPTTTLATCWKVVRADGTTMGFTDHVANLTVSGVVHEAATGYTPTALKGNATLSVDNMDVIGLLNASGITAADIEGKKYDNAEVFMFVVNYKDTAMGTAKLGHGRIGNITLQDNTYVAEFRSLSQLLQQNVGERYSLRCRAALGDTRCGIPLVPSAWVSSTVYAASAYVQAASYTGRIFRCTTPGTSGGTEPAFSLTVGASTADASAVWTTENAWTKRLAVTSVTSRRQFYASALISVVAEYVSTMTSVPVSNFYAGGLVTWQASATNSTYAAEVKSYSSGTVTLVEDMPYTILASDVFEIYPGCDKRFIETCKNKFSNVVNFRGEPYIPGAHDVLKFGGQG